jgi:hypothetical protein
MSMERKTIIVNTMATEHWEVGIFCKKCSCTYLLKKKKVWDKKHFFPKCLKEATNDYFLYVLDNCLLNRYKQASFI